MDLNFNDRPIFTPGSVYTPVSAIKNKRLKQETHAEGSVTIQFFTPENKENSTLTLSDKRPGLFIAKSFHNTGFTPKTMPCTEKKIEDPNNSCI